MWRKQAVPWISVWIITVTNWLVYPVSTHTQFHNTDFDVTLRLAVIHTVSATTNTSTLALGRSLHSGLGTKTETRSKPAITPFSFHTSLYPFLLHSWPVFFRAFMPFVFFSVSRHIFCIYHLFFFWLGFLYWLCNLLPFHCVSDTEALLFWLFPILNLIFRLRFRY